MMNSKIVETLEMMCDKSNPQDKKLLLLAELVETKCTALADNQQVLQRSLNNTNDKLDKLTNLLEKFEREESECPVFQSRENFKKLAIFIKYPKLSLLALLGVLALILGLFNSSFIGIIKIIFGI